MASRTLHDKSKILYRAVVKQEVIRRHWKLRWQEGKGQMKEGAAEKAFRHVLMV